METERRLDVIIICGPTASGKTDLALKLAEIFDIEIISADSRQVYKYLDIGTAKPTPEELSKAKHHFIDFLEPDEYFSAGVFGENAYKKAIEIRDIGKLPVVVGGSGLYIKAFAEGIFADDTKVDKSIKDDIQQIYDELGKDRLYEMLIEVDPISAAKYYDRNPVRVMRALAYFYATDLKFSDAQNNMPERNINPLYYAIDHNRNVLYDRINRRTELMWEMGFEQETRNILEKGFSPKLNSLNTVGYKECIDYIRGSCDKQFAIEEMKKNTRRFAKRQLTWFRKIDGLRMLSDNIDEALKAIELDIKSLK
jgi:tRNA dimethylallyltransferase